MSSISAATSSSVLAHAGPITRLGLFQQAPEKDISEEMASTAKKMVNASTNGHASLEDYAKFAKEFGIDSQTAASILGRVSQQLRPSSSSSPPPMDPSFAGTDMSKLAKAGIGDLLNGIAVFNASIKNWSADRIKENWENFWQQSYQGALEKYNGDQAKAIKDADEGLQYIIDNTGRGGDRSVLDKALGQLSSAFNIDYTKFVTEKEDGTIALNYDFLKDTSFGKAVGLTQNYGYLVDKAA